MSKPTLPNNDLNNTLALEKNEEAKQIWDVLSKKQPKKPYNRDEDIKRRKRQKENYAKKQAEKGLIVRPYKKFNEEYAIVHRKSISICRLNFN